MIRNAMASIGITLSLSAAVVSPAFAQEATTYSYDALGRLISVSRSGGPNDGKQTQTGFDAAGNRVSYSVSSGSPPPPTCSLTASGDTWGPDEFSIYPYIMLSGACSGPVTLSYTVQRLSGSGNYDVTVGTPWGPFDPENSSDTSRYIRIAPYSSSISPGDNLILKVTWTIVSGNAAMVDADTQVMFCDDGSGC